MQTLPPPRRRGRYLVALVCLGNICRSPMAHVVLQQHLTSAGLADRVGVRSAGTGDWHVGKPMDRRAAATLTEAGYDPTRHRGRQFEARWFAELDLVLAMDADNLADLRDLLPAEEDPGRLLRFRDLDPESADGDRDVPDPYYGDEAGFDRVLGQVERTAVALTGLLAARLLD